MTSYEINWYCAMGAVGYPVGLSESYSSSNKPFDSQEIVAYNFLNLKVYLPP